MIDEIENKKYSYFYEIKKIIRNQSQPTPTLPSTSGFAWQHHKIHVHYCGGGATITCAINV